MMVVSDWTQQGVCVVLLWVAILVRDPLWSPMIRMNYKSNSFPQRQFAHMKAKVVAYWRIISLLSPSQQNPNFISVLIRNPVVTWLQRWLPSTLSFPLNRCYSLIERSGVTRIWAGLVWPIEYGRRIWHNSIQRVLGLAVSVSCLLWLPCKKFRLLC